MKIDYIITGDVNQISEMMIPVMKENRFLSDKPNVKSFTWYPVTTDVQAVEMAVTKRPTDEEISFLCRDFETLTVGVITPEGDVSKLITNESTEVM